MPKITKLKDQFVYNHDSSFYCDIEIKNGIILKIIPKQKPKSKPKFYTLPGFVDSHSHGGYGFDFNSLSGNNWQSKISNYLKIVAKEGVTKVIGTTVSCPINDLFTIARNFKEMHLVDKNKIIETWYIEGPFLSVEKKGAHEESLIAPIDLNVLNELTHIYPKKKLIAIAPEYKDNLKKIKTIDQQSYLMCLGHSNANAAISEKAFKDGMHRLVHFYNAMSGFNHREPGVVNFAFNHKNIQAELICDGIHVNPYVIENTFNILSPDNIVLISDSLSCKGLKNGFYKSGNLDIEKTNDICYIKGTKMIAGSVMPYDSQVKVFKKATKCSINDLVKITSYNVAKILNKQNEFGEIKKGAIANFTIVDQNLNIMKTISNGNLVYSKK